MGFLPFVESFVLKVLQENFSMITNLLMFIDPQVPFVMFSFSYAQQPN
jgi:hypothetical protein